MKKATISPAVEITEEQIAQRAYFVFTNRCENNIPGNPDTDWLQAEVLLIAEAESAKPAKAARTKKSSAKASVTIAKKPAAKAKPAAAKKENLTEIKGLGPVFVKKLAALKITTFAQIAGLKKADIEELEAKLKAPGRITRDKWVAQAKKLAK